MGLTNFATLARNIIPEGDCTTIKHFIGQTKGKKGSTSYWTFGHIYNYNNYYYCASYGSLLGTGTKENESSKNRNRQIICPCSQGKNSQGVLE